MLAGQWRTHADETGTRALQGLRTGVAAAIEALGTGFMQHPANTALRQALAAGTVSCRDVHQALLRLVYRPLFCFVSEDRGLLLDPAADPLARARYERWFSTGRLRRVARRRRGTLHGDLWQALQLVFDGLGREGGRPELGLHGIGGLFELGPADVMAGCELSNEALLAAVRRLSVVQPPGGGPRRVVDYRNLGAEELGGVYESLLELVPRLDLDRRQLTLEVLAGNERKTSGSYYTPTSLIDCVLDSALDPLLDDAERSADPEAALLALTVCDPACGSGHFLVAAARRIAARLALVRSGGGQPSVLDEQAAMAEVVERCVYGVDLNPLAAELAKVGLWLESMRPGRPLGFLDAHVKVGNALLGATPALLAAGIPDGAFTALDGDDKRWTASLRKRNARERRGEADLFAAAGVTVATGALAAELAALDVARPVSLQDVHVAEHRFRQFDSSPRLRRRRLVADAWCAAFVAPKVPGAPELTQAVLQRWDANPPAEDDPVVGFVAELSQRARYFHWHLEFPQIFTVDDTTVATTETGWTGGFSCVIGNPPWEHVELKEQEFFAARDASIAEASGAARKSLIDALTEANPALHAEYLDAKRLADGERHFLGASGRYPLCGRGRINTYAVFAEHDRAITAEHGRLTVILPTGIATDATTQHFFKDLVQRRELVSLYDFYEVRKLFPATDDGKSFCLLTLAGEGIKSEAAEFAFSLLRTDELDQPGRRYLLTTDELALVNPNTGTCPIFRSRRDAEITLAIYRRWPVLVREGDPDGNPWGLSFMQGLFNMTSASHLFRTRAELEADGWTLAGNTFTRGDERMLPLYEAKMIHHFDHRFGDYRGVDLTTGRAVRSLPTPSDQAHADPDYVPLPRYWIPSKEMSDRLLDRWDRSWLMAFRDVTEATDERTMIVAVLRLSPVGHNAPLLMVEADAIRLLPVLSSFVFDYVARQKLSGNHMTYFILKQLPVPPPVTFHEPCPWEPAMSYAAWITPRLLELTYTAHDMAPFAADLGDRAASRSAGIPPVGRSCEPSSMAASSACTASTVTTRPTCSARSRSPTARTPGSSAACSPPTTPSPQQLPPANRFAARSTHAPAMVLGTHE